MRGFYSRGQAWHTGFWEVGVGGNRAYTPVMAQHPSDSIHAQDPATLTPAMRQYQQYKVQYPDAILFFRIGDFYECFYEDARTVARVLGVALTARSKGENAVPMAGVPFHAVETYLHRMIAAGFKVAICE